MHSEYRFSDLTESLKNGFLADEIVLTLARAERGDLPGAHERKLLAQAVTLLTVAEEGSRWLDNPKLTGDSKTAATFFGRAVKALPNVYTSEVFLQRITELKETASQLSEGQGLPPVERIRFLRTFFFNAARSELDRTEELLDGESSIDALKWTVSNK